MFYEVRCTQYYVHVYKLDNVHVSMLKLCIALTITHEIRIYVCNMYTYNAQASIPNPTPPQPPACLLCTRPMIKYANVQVILYAPPSSLYLLSCSTFPSFPIFPIPQISVLSLILFPYSAFSYPYTPICLCLCLSLAFTLLFHIFYL